MKLHILSDLHLEFSQFEPIENDADVVILAGDIGKRADGLHWAREAFPGKAIVYVPGNHEFYRSDRIETLQLMRMTADQLGIHLLDNDEVVIGDVRFLGATLWTDFELHGADMKPYTLNEGQRLLNDFRVIHDGLLGAFTPQRSIELHNESLSWLNQKLAVTFDGKTVVVTHHLPSMLSVAERYKTSLLSACFASNLDDLFGRMDLWIHGHTHDNFDYEAFGTRVICNPRGYVTYSGAENFDFNPRLVIEI